MFMDVKRPKKLLSLCLCFILTLPIFSVFLVDNVRAESSEEKESYIIRLKKDIDSERWLSKKAINYTKSSKIETRSATIFAKLSSNELKRMKTDSDISFIEKDHPIQLSSLLEEVPNEIHSVIPWGLTATQAVYAHQEGITGKHIKIAVLDTGVSSNHPDLFISGGQSFVEGTTTYEDDNGHGTHVTGIINASHNNYGISGMAPDAEIFALKVLDSEGKGYYSSVIEAIEWSIVNGIQIVSMSFGGNEYSEALHQVIQEASAEYGILFVAAAGNQGIGEETETYPSLYSEVLSVGSVNSIYQRSSFSSTGNELDLMAPGEQIWSTSKDGGYRQQSGTSMAVPYVTGVAALIWSEDLSQSVGQIKEKLLKNAALLGTSHEYGLGMVQVVGGIPLPEQTNPPSIIMDTPSKLSHEIRGLMEKFLDLQKKAIEQEKTELSKEIFRVYNELKIEYCGVQLRLDESNQTVSDLVYSKSVSESVYFSPSVTKIVYESNLNSLSYMHPLIQDNIAKILSDYTEKYNDFIAFLKDSSTDPSMGTLDYGQIISKVGDYQVIFAGSPVTVSFRMAGPVYNFNVTINGPAYGYSSSAYLGNGYYDPNFPSYTWNTPSSLQSGSYTITLWGEYPDSIPNSYRTFSVTYNILINNNVVISPIRIDTPVDTSTVKGELKRFSYTTGNTIERLEIKTTYFGGNSSSGLSDTVLSIYADSTMNNLIAFNDDASAGSQFSSCLLTIKPNSTIYIKLAGYNNNSIFTRLVVTKTTASPNFIIGTFSQDYSLPTSVAQIIGYIPNATGTYKISTSSYGGTGYPNNTMLYLYSDSGLTQTLAFNDDAGGTTFSEITFTMYAGVQYYIILSGYSNTNVYARLNIQLDSIPPTIPTNLRFTNVYTNSAILQWDASTDNGYVMSYKIYRNGSLYGTVPGDSTSYTVGPLSDVYLNSFTVRAFDSNGNFSEASNSVQLVDPDPPTAPKNLRFNMRGTTSASLQWDYSLDNVGVANYKIYKNGSFVAVIPSNANTYTVTGLTANSLYIFTVRAFDASGNISAESNRIYYAIGNVTYHYDTNGRLYQLSFPSGQIVNIITDANGNINQISLP